MMFGRKNNMETQLKKLGEAEKKISQLNSDLDHIVDKRSPPKPQRKSISRRISNSHLDSSDPNL